MTHTFFNHNTNYHVEEQFDKDQFIVEIAFAPDDTQLDLLFDTDMEGYDELIENLESGFWQHMICRVQAKYDGKVMGEEYLGSILAESPAKWIESDKDYIDDLVDSAMDEARENISALKTKLGVDFP